MMDFRIEDIESIYSTRRMLELEPCARCGFSPREHSYNGACYGLCAEWVTHYTKPNNLKDLTEGFQ